MNNKIMVYYDRWDGWSLWAEGILHEIGFLSAEADSAIRQYCNQRAKRVGWGIGLAGWEF